MKSIAPLVALLAIAVLSIIAILLDSSIGRSTLRLGPDGLQLQIERHDRQRAPQEAATAPSTPQTLPPSARRW